MSLEKLRPVENLSQVDKIELSLQEYLHSENFQPGDSLPKEIELAQAMGVSRTAIREALSRFRTLGIIETRKNRGMVIAKPDVLNNMERVLHPRLLDQETMNEIFEMRLVVEVGMADLLFLRTKGAKDLSRLEKIVEKEEKSTRKTDIIKCDLEFHSTLYHLSGNKTIMRFQKMLQPIFDHVYATLSKTDTHKAKRRTVAARVTHRDLLNTLKHGDPEIFRSQMRNHLGVYFKQIPTQ